MFLQASVSHSVHRRVVGIPGPMSFLGDMWVPLLPGPYVHGEVVPTLLLTTSNTLLLKLVTATICMVLKQVVSILLECFLV